MESYKEKYKNTLPYPDRNDYKTVFIYSGGKCIYQAPYNTYITTEWKHKDAIKEIIVDEDGYKAERKKYNEEDARLYFAFKMEIEEDHGMIGHPKADRVFALAWEEGHSSGYDEVACVYDKYADLVKD